MCSVVKLGIFLHFMVSRLSKIRHLVSTISSSLWKTVISSVRVRLAPTISGEMKLTGAALSDWMRNRRQSAVASGRNRPAVAAAVAGVPGPSVRLRSSRIRHDRKQWSPKCRLPSAQVSLGPCARYGNQMLTVRTNGRAPGLEHDDRHSLPNRPAADRQGPGDGTRLGPRVPANNADGNGRLPVAADRLMSYLVRQLSKLQVCWRIPRQLCDRQLFKSH